MFNTSPDQLFLLNIMETVQVLEIRDPLQLRVAETQTCILDLPLNTK